MSAASFLTRLEVTHRIKSLEMREESSFTAPMYV